MFNGIIFNTGKVKLIKKGSKSILIRIDSKLSFSRKDLGSSVCCNGVCLTIVNVKGYLIDFYISNETLNRSNFRSVKINQIINLEKSLTFGQSVSGNFAQGHVDAVAKVKKITIIDKMWLIKFVIKDKKFNKFVVEKASISINGVSLTISKAANNFFEVSIIPHSLKLTNLKFIKINDLVNVELDIFGKYIYKYTI